MIKPIRWDPDKNIKLKLERGVCFEDFLLKINTQEFLDVIEHPNPDKYGRQKVFIFEHEGYVVAVPFVEEETYIFLKTIIPSRKLTKKYLGNK